MEQPRLFWSRTLLLATLTLLLWSSVAFTSLPLQSPRITSPSQPKTLRFALDVSNSENDEQAFISSVLYDGTFEGVDDGMLAYLPDGGKTIPPRTRRLVSQITSQFIYGIEGQPNLSSRTIVEVIKSEYESLPVSMTVGNRTFGSGGGDLLVVQIVSLAVLHQLPSEIMLKVVDCAATENQALRDFKTEFEAVGWEQVSFPAGLSIRIKKGLISRTTQPSDQSFFPPSRLPWRSRSSSRAAEAAQKGIRLASEAKAPEQTIRTKEEFLVEMENEIQAPPLSEVAVTEPSDMLSSEALSLQDALPSFPSEGYSRAWTKVKRVLMTPSPALASNAGWKKFSNVMDTQYKKMKDAGRAGLMAYAFMNFVLYTVGVTWQWRRIAVEVPLPAGATMVSLTLRKFIKAFTRVYVASAVFKLVRVGISLALAPAAGRVLSFTQRKLKVSENAALVILITLLIKTFLGTLAVVCLGDTALRNAIRSL